MITRMRGWNPWDEMRRVEREIDQMFGTGTANFVPPEVPAVNVWSSDDKIVVTAELPGVDTDSLDVSVKNDTLTLRGERKTVDEPDEMKYIRRERETGHFTRSFTLPMKVDADNVTAEYRRGVLEIALPRAEEDKPKRISVKSAS